MKHCACDVDGLDKIGLADRIAPVGQKSLGIEMAEDGRFTRGLFRV